MTDGAGAGTGRFGLWLRTPTAGDLLDLCRQMRALDAAEIFALRSHSDPDRLALEIYAALPRAARAYAIGLDSGRGVKAFLALWPMDESGALASAHLFATDDFPRVAPRLVRFVRRTLIPEMMAAGMRRAECRVMERHAPSRAFLRACGAVEESGPLLDMAPNGESYILAAWRLSDWCNDHVLQHSQTSRGLDRRSGARIASGGRRADQRAA